MPAIFTQMMASPDLDRVKRAATAMLTMVKFDIAAVQAAFDGTS